MLKRPNRHSRTSSPILYRDNQAISIEIPSPIHRREASRNLQISTGDQENFSYQANQTGIETDPKQRSKDIATRYFILICCIFFLIIGRYSVPVNEPACIVDKIMDLLDGMNTYVLSNPPLRDMMMIINSAFMDITFLTTFLYWVHFGTSGRLILSMAMFYLIRATVQSFWYMPFPEKGYWWYDPGFPSLVVPYGRGSDFFFSGHIGFIVICGNEWKKYNKPFMVNLLTVGGIYTAFILILYRIHYSIDVFAGVIVAHWCFMVVDNNKEKIDSIFSGVYDNVKGRSQETTKIRESEQPLLPTHSYSMYSDVELKKMTSKVRPPPVCSLISPQNALRINLRIERANSARVLMGKKKRLQETNN